MAKPGYIYQKGKNVEKLYYVYYMSYILKLKKKERINKLKQLVRVRGKHLGTHYIFDDYSEAKSYLSQELSHLNVNNQDLSSVDCFPHWLSSVKEGDWITCDDGKVVQVLRIYTLSGDKRKKGAVPYNIICIKTAGALGSYTIKDGVKFSKYGLKITEQSIQNNESKQSMKGGGNRYELKRLLHKRMFVYYLVVYMSPVMAYKLVWNWKNKSKQHQISFSAMHREAYKLMQDKTVIEELEKYMKVDTFREKLRKELEEQNITEERIVKELSLGLEAVKKGSQTHKQFIELATNLNRFASPEKEDIGVDGKPLAKISSAVLDADYEYLPEPPAQIEKHIDEDTKQIVIERNNKVFEKVISELSEEDMEENKL